MTNEQLDKRLEFCAEVVRDLVKDLGESEPSIEQAVAFGAVSSALATLELCAGQKHLVRSHAGFSFILGDLVVEIGGDDDDKG